MSKSNHQVDRAARRRARYQIVDQANKHCLAWQTEPYRMRHLQRCVCIVRRRRLVKPSVLIAAGFNPA